MKLGIILNSRFKAHQTPRGHPERPERIQALLDRRQDWNDLPGVSFLAPVPGKVETVLKVHRQDYVQVIAETSRKPGTSLDPDTWAGPDSYETALLAVGSSIELLAHIFRDDLNAGLLLARPPGHHAESSRAMGFCLFNTAAIAAQWALDQEFVERVAIVDFDVHHGNGTQEIFWRRSDVFYLSTHQYPLYPGTGSDDETGQGKGIGFTLNFPLPAGTRDSAYVNLFAGPVREALEGFRPEFLIVSAGYDAHRNDPLAGMEMTEAGFDGIVRELKEAALELCQGRLFLVLEGGYDLKALRDSVDVTIRQIVDN